MEFFHYVLGLLEREVLELQFLLIVCGYWVDRDSAQKNES